MRWAIEKSAGGDDEPPVIEPVPTDHRREPFGWIFASHDPGVVELRHGSGES